MNLCFIGGGNMASALIGGLIESQTALQRLHVVEPDSDARERLLSRFASPARAHGIDLSMDASDSPGDLAQEPGATWVVLAVKPQNMREACLESAPGVRHLLQHSLLLSIAAGVSVQAISNWCAHSRIVRAMPNTPALVGSGVTGLFASSNIPAQARAQAEQLMSAVGRTVWIENEELMDAVTALSGSGPAYVFRFIEALTAAGAELGLSMEQSALLALETVKGATALLESSGESPASLREKVTSRGGTTAAALASLDASGFMTVIAEALRAARDRGTAMSREFR
jgi:pyrroline-5-carboxylate reductase